MSLVVLGILVLSGFSLLVLSGPVIQKAKASGSWPNETFVNLYIARNGSDPGAPFPYANQPPVNGMNYYGTNKLVVSWDYSLNDINDSSLFPSDAKIWYAIPVNDPGSAANVANHAVFNNRIMGAIIDDFPVGTQSATNMSAVYTALHHEDGTIGRTLTLILTVYESNYHHQTPYSWASIHSYYDGIDFWFYPRTYDLLYPEFIGYEDCFLDMRTIAPDKTFWLGIYLHYYNIGTYPIEFTTDQLRFASRLVREGKATEFSLLADFWIPNNPETAALIRSYINDEYAPDYAGNLNVTTGYATAYISNFEQIPGGGYRFQSDHLENITITNSTFVNPRAQDVRTGRFVDVWKDGSYFRFIAAPGETYKIVDMGLTNKWYNSTTYIETNTAWSNERVFVNCQLYINRTLAVTDSIIEMGNNGTDTIDIGINPAYGIFVNATGNFYFVNSTLEPVHRYYTYLFNAGSPVLGTKHFVITNSTIVGVSGLIRWMTYIYINDTRFFGVQPDGTGLCSFFFVIAPARVWTIQFQRNVIWNYEVTGLIGFYLQPGELYVTGSLNIRDCVIAGGTTGLFIEMNGPFGFNTTLRNVTTFSTFDMPIYHPPNHIWEEKYNGILYDTGRSKAILTLQFDYFATGTPIALTIWTNRTLYGNITMFPSSSDKVFIAQFWLPYKTDNATMMIENIPSDVVYSLYRNGTLIHSQKGGDYDFTVVNESWYNLDVWFTRPIQPMVILVMTLYSLSLVVMTVKTTIAPFINDRRKEQQIDGWKYLVRSFVMLIIGLTGLSMIAFVGGLI